MVGEAPIGRVVCVSGTQVVALLDHEGEAGRRVEKGAILKIPLARSAVFCMVSGLSVPVPGERPGPGEARLAELELLGESRAVAEGGPSLFRRGIRAYPALGDWLHPVEDEDLERIYGQAAACSVPIGALHHASARPVSVSPDNLLGKHFAVLGTTGSGKSCAVTVLLRGLLERHPNAHIVLLDLHNEYGAAFGERAVVLGPGTLQLPYWLLTAEEIQEVVVGPARGNGIADAAGALLPDIVALAKRAYCEGRADGLEPTVDTPIPYRLGDVDRVLDEVMGRLDKPDSLGPYRWLKARFAALARDPRYGFMFGGIAVHDNLARILSTVFRIPPDGRPVTIVDLSSVPSETLNVVAAVLLRIAFDFALWGGGAVPILLVCEEAHRYVPAAPGSGFAHTRQAMARIAKEGRKYGLSLGIVSQRPSELEPSILSQCNTVFAFRMTSLRDQEFLRGVMSDSACGLLDFLPALGDAEAIVAGQAVPVPVRIRFPDLPPEHRPKGASASFSTAWQGEGRDAAFVAEVVRQWRRQGR